ncbi:MAG TPA: hypothetical protein VF849_00140 [Blattabacteriaceae bacterium]
MNTIKLTKLINETVEAAGEQELYELGLHILKNCNRPSCTHCQEILKAILEDNEKPN